MSRSLNKIISDKQHGFREKKSTISKLVIYVNGIFQSFYQKNQVDTVYTDFSRAFDSVNHELIIKKLEFIGLNSKTVKLVSNYLKDRMLIVVIGQSEEVPFIAVVGVAQGSYFGPLLLCFFVNDLLKVILNSSCLLYADDLKLYKIINKEDKINDQFKIQDNLNKVSK